MKIGKIERKLSEREIIEGLKGIEYLTAKEQSYIEQAIELMENNNKIIMWEDIDKEEVSKAVVLLDLFTKTFCRYKNDYERFNDLKFRCDECLFNKSNGDCICKEFKNKYAPDYRDFGSMGDL